VARLGPPDFGKVCACAAPPHQTAPSAMAADNPAAASMVLADLTNLSRPAEIIVPGGIRRALRQSPAL